MKLLKYIVGKKGVTLLIIDIGIIVVASIVANLLRFGWIYGQIYLRENIFAFGLSGIIFLVLFYIADLYDFKRDFRQPKEIIIALFTCFIAFVFSSFMIYGFQLWLPGRGIFILYGGLVTFGIIFKRCMYAFLVRQHAFKTKIVIIGTDEPQKALAEKIIEEKGLDVNLVGFINDMNNKETHNGEVNKLDYCIIHNVVLPILGKIDNLEEIIRQHQISKVILKDKYQVDDKTKNILTRCFIKGVKITDVPTFYSETWRRIPISWISKEWLYQELLKEKPFVLYYQNLTRLMDVVLSGIVLILFFPLFVLISILIKLDSKGSVFYLQKRLGVDMKKFCTIKFRTMVKDAEKKSGMVWVTENDSRITRVGKFLRKTRLDELPQLINVFKGEMSLVGPRPERGKFVMQFLEESGVFDRKIKTKNSDLTIPYYSLRLLVKPGITGWAQINYGYANSRETSKEKLEYDLYYILNRSFLLDIGILLRTLKVVLLGKGK